MSETVPITSTMVDDSSPTWNPDPISPTGYIAMQIYGFGMLAAFCILAIYTVIYCTFIKPRKARKAKAKADIEKTIPTRTRSHREVDTEYPTSPYEHNAEWASDSTLDLAPHLPARAMVSDKVRDSYN